MRFLGIHLWILSKTGSKKGSSEKQKKRKILLWGWESLCVKAKTEWNVWMTQESKQSPGTENKDAATGNGFRHKERWPTYSFPLPPMSGAFTASCCHSWCKAEAINLLCACARACAIKDSAPEPFSSGRWCHSLHREARRPLSADFTPNSLLAAAGWHHPLCAKFSQCTIIGNYVAIRRFSIDATGNTSTMGDFIIFHEISGGYRHIHNLVFCEHDALWGPLLK